MMNGGSSFVEGQFLIAMPSIGDSRFRRSVILICAHSSDGAMGLILN
ncbi:MAG: YqgE/AlgH family protein, partial [Pseudomonadota bacterium]